MAERQISKEIVLGVLEKPQQIVANFGGRRCYQSKLEMGNTFEPILERSTDQASS
jgi:hypothetical protein